MTASSNARGSGQPPTVPPFDVHSFLRKTLSDFSSIQQPIIDSPSPSAEPHRNTSLPLSVKRSKTRGKHHRPIDRRFGPGPNQTGTEGEAKMLERNVPGNPETERFLKDNRPNDGPDDADSVPAEPPPAVPMYVKITPSASKNSLASATSSIRPLCRICQITGEPNDNLISPCRCAGTMQYVHTGCLVTWSCLQHWLEISTRKMRPAPQCELCGYHYRTRRCLGMQKAHTPQCSARDRALHFVFVLVLFVMVGCGALSVLYLKSDQNIGMRNSLSGNDVIVIFCSILFFCAFFLAVFTQYKAEASLCRLFFRCWLINRHWRITNYDPKEDCKWTDYGQEERGPLFTT